MSDYDVIIDTSGGTLARHLVPSGKRILLLERGDWLPSHEGPRSRSCNRS